jgi:hypothetical protein
VYPWTHHHMGGGGCYAQVHIRTRGDWTRRLMDHVCPSLDKLNSKNANDSKRNFSSLLGGRRESKSRGGAGGSFKLGNSAELGLDDTQKGSGAAPATPLGEEETPSSSSRRSPRMHAPLFAARGVTPAAGQRAWPRCHAPPSLSSSSLTHDAASAWQTTRRRGRWCTPRSRTRAACGTTCTCVWTGRTARGQSTCSTTRWRCWCVARGVKNLRTRRERCPTEPRGLLLLSSLLR